VIWFFATTLLSAAAFGAGRAAVGKGRKTGLFLFAGALVLLIAKAWLSWHPALEYRLLYFPAWVYLEGWLGFPLALYSLGAACRLLPRHRDRRAIVLLAIFLFMVSVWSSHWMAVHPGLGSDRRPGPDHHLMQSTGWSCGPAACAILLSLHGIDATEAEMADRCQAGPFAGTSVFRIARGSARRSAPGCGWTCWTGTRK
jgi:hypothetical protein